MKKYFFILFFLVSALVVQSQTFSYTVNCKKAYENIIALKIDSGHFYIQAEKQANPDNYYVLLLENYVDFLSIYCSGKNEDIEEKHKVFDSRIKSIKNTDLESSPYFLYIQAEIQLQTAILLVQNNEYISTLFYLRRSLKLLEENMEKFPNFKANKKSLGVLYSILGSVPDSFKTGLSIIGLNGDINEGMKMLKTLSLDKSFEYQHETTTIYAFMLLHLNNDPEKAWQVLKSNRFFNSYNKMDTYAVGHIGIYGMHNDEGIATLQKNIFSKQYLEFPLIDFMIGLGKTYRQDTDANKYFESFLVKNKGKDHIKSAYQKMAWNELIKGNDEKYFELKEKIKNNGRTQIDADKQAEKEVYNLTIPNAVLLQTRLLTDGNYTARAFKILSAYDEDFFLMPKDKAEYNYRMGRILEKQAKFEEAIEKYQKTIELNQSIEAYFGANACYLIGNIYEKQKDETNAVLYYEKCLKMNGYEYHNSIMQKAKAGKNRISKSFF